MESPKLYIAWIMLFVVSVPLALNLVPPNGFYGLRIGSTLANPEVWRKGNVFSGWVMMAGAVIGAAITRYFPDVAENWGNLLVVVVAVLVAVISILYVKLVS